MLFNQIDLRLPVCAVVLAGMILVQSCTVTDPCGSCGQAVVSEPFEYHFSAENISDFSVKGMSGDIEISGVSGDSIEVWGERSVRAETESEAWSELSRLTIEIKRYGDEIGLQTGQPSETRDRSYEVTYHVRMPRRLNASAAVLNGNILIADLESRVQSETLNGNIELDHIQGSNMASTVNGSVNGNVTLSGQQICAYNVVNGNVKLTIPETISAKFEASVVNGRIAIQDLEIQNLTTTKTTAAGQLGDGSGQIQLQTVNGNIQVNGV